MQAAAQLAERMSNPSVEPEHLIKSLVDQQGGVCVGANAVAALEQISNVARFPYRSVGALRVEIDRVMALEGDVSWRALTDELQIE